MASLLLVWAAVVAILAAIHVMHSFTHFTAMHRFRCGISPPPSQAIRQHPAHTEILCRAFTGLWNLLDVEGNMAHFLAHRGLELALQVPCRATGE